MITKKKKKKRKHMFIWIVVESCEFFPPWLIEQLKCLFSNPGMFLATYFKEVLPKMFHLKPYAE